MNPKPCTRARTAGIPAAAILLASALCPAPAAGEDFTARMLDTGGSLPRKNTAYVQIHIERWTTDDEARRFLQILASSGSDGLMKELWNLDNGWISIGDRLGYPLSVTRSHERDGKRIVRILTDRPIQIFEVMDALRTTDYPFGIIELTLDENGRGEGRVMAAAKAGFTADGTLEVESYGIEPLRLVDVRTKVPKKDKSQNKPGG
jgi:hypothetical protein